MAGEDSINTPQSTAMDPIHESENQKKCKDHVDITQNSIDTPQSTSMDPILDEIIFNSF